MLASPMKGTPGMAIESRVDFCTVRDGGEDWHLECRFEDGQKFAAIRVDKECHDLADYIAHILNAHAAKNRTPNASA